ncbi:class I SAM-dependent methyltransferase [Candidatus Competibacter phosphatis]|uniref:Class I SAM-dependent methyltransferase n=1 Tax=Candidatus Competibacter phosphatis TaxID=221280 RepID=A0ABX1TPM6_9GAMM|nr:class I SAM-dependent methyltransferase [Candidatus Competibacter phosphatis]NMQ20634.1 class I SAM-dependent methyltransferase [Candidatus Competibacter phosphatis]
MSHYKKKSIKIAVKLMNILDIKNVLDIACGDGKHLIEFKNLGCNCYGTEYDAWLEKLGQEKGINMISGGIFPSKPYENISFDLVIFTEIIEHINNPRKVLMNIHYLLNKDGILYITTPNFNSIERKVLGKNWGMICYPEHISYYSPKTLHKLLTQCGFEKIYLYTENISIFRIVQYMQRRKAKKRYTAKPRVNLSASSKFI